jgi:hypothetical protein
MSCGMRKSRETPEALKALRRLPDFPRKAKRLERKSTAELTVQNKEEMGS